MAPRPEAITRCDDGAVTKPRDAPTGEDDQPPLEDQLGAAHPMEFDGLTDLQVFGQWAEVMLELARRELIWSGKSPLADPGFRSWWVNGSPDLSGGAWVFGLFGRVRPCAHARVGSRALLRRM